MSKYLSNEQIVELTKIEDRDVSVPALSAPVRMRSCSLLEKDACSQEAMRAGSNGKPSGLAFMIHLVHRTIAEPTMTIEQVARLPKEALEQLFREALIVNGLDKEVAARIDQSFHVEPGQAAPVQVGAVTGADTAKVGG